MKSNMEKRVFYYIFLQQNILFIFENSNIRLNFWKDTYMLDGFGKEGGG